MAEEIGLFGPASQWLPNPGVHNQFRGPTPPAPAAAPMRPRLQTPAAPATPAPPMPGASVPVANVPSIGLSPAGSAIQKHLSQQMASPQMSQVAHSEQAPTQEESSSSPMYARNPGGPGLWALGVSMQDPGHWVGPPPGEIVPLGMQSHHSSQGGGGSSVAPSTAPNPLERALAMSSEHETRSAEANARSPMAEAAAMKSMATDPATREMLGVRYSGQPLGPMPLPPGAQVGIQNKDQYLGQPGNEALRAAIGTNETSLDESVERTEPFPGSRTPGHPNYEALKAAFQQRYANPDEWAKQQPKNWWFGGALSPGAVKRRNDNLLRMQEAGLSPYQGAP